MQLPHHERAEVCQDLDLMKAMQCEELEAKFNYWEELPHLMLYMWPHDAQSQAVAEKVLHKWSLVEGTPQEGRCHRVTFRMLHPDSGQPYPAM
eukprot:6690500-Heterocapsa_arctica.AAC.1